MGVKLVGTQKELEQWKKKSLIYNFSTLKMIMVCIVLTGVVNTLVTNLKIQKEEELNRKFVESLNYTKELYKDDHMKLAQAMDALIKKEMN